MTPGSASLEHGAERHRVPARGACERVAPLGGLPHTLRRDLRIAWRRPGDVLAGVAFFGLVASLFPLATSPDPAQLRALGPGAIWVAALLATLLSLPRMLADDARDGTLEQLALSSHPLASLVLGKVVAHWLGSGLLLALVSPLLGLQFGLSASAIGVLVLALLLGTPVLSLLGAVAAALTLGLRGGGLLLPLLLLPLAMPVLVFGAGAVTAAAAGRDFGGHLSLLAAMGLAALCGAPWAAASAIRIALD